MATQQKKSPRLAVVGGGITGLTAAYYALKNGQDPSQITVYEAGNRLGGKIQTGYMGDGRAVNMGAEFIDSDHTQLLEMCKELDVKLKPSTDSGNESYIDAKGKPVSGEKFHKEFGPLHKQIMRDKQEVTAHPDGPKAKEIDGMSMAQYMETIRASTPIDYHPNFLQKFWHFVTGDHNQVRPEIADMAMNAFASETGRPPKDINALQFLHEVSAEKGTFLSSDCGFRVEGGTENVIKKLEAHLKEQGVRFEQNAPLKKIQKSGAGLTLDFGDRREAAQTDKVVMALPAYALGKVEGLNALGMSEETQAKLGNTQYTSGYKITVKLKPGQAPQDGAFFANGYQVWSANPDEVTFLVNNNDATKGKTPVQVAKEYMQDYAQAKGVDFNAFYDMSQGNVILSNPGKAACYASPAPGKARELEHLDQSLEGMEANGVAIAGTYIPLKTPGSIGLGFMECGVNSAGRAIDRLIPVQKERAGYMEQILNPQLQAQGRGQAFAAR